MLMIVAIWWVVGALIVAAVGDSKGRAAEGVAASLFGSPIFGILCVIALDARPKKAAQQ